MTMAGDTGADSAFIIILEQLPGDLLIVNLTTAQPRLSQENLCTGLSTSAQSWPWENTSHGDLSGAQCPGGYADLWPNQEGISQTLRAGTEFNRI